MLCAPVGMVRRVAPTNFYEEVRSQNGVWGRSNLKAV
jgi:hypothetical protein